MLLGCGWPPWMEWMIQKEARRRISHLASAGSDALERARLAAFVHPPMWRQRVTTDDAREELIPRTV